MEKDNSIVGLEWCPGVEGISLVGDFSKLFTFLLLCNPFLLDNWDTNAHQYEQLEHGHWRIQIPPGPDGKPLINHGAIFKVAVKKDGHFSYKLSPWANYVERSKTNIYEMVFYNPSEHHEFKNPRPAAPEDLRIYEAHVGISSPEGKINTYRAFADDVIPRIKNQEYNWLGAG